MTSTDTASPLDVLGELIHKGFSSIGNLFRDGVQSLIEVMRQPTPNKVAFQVLTSSTGAISPTTIWMNPMSQEAWINRIAISAVGYTPAAPLTTGWLTLNGAAGDLIYAFPISGTTVAPVVIAEGRVSAPHLNSGSSLSVTGAALPPNISIRFDLQIVLVSGVSQYTPRDKTLLDINP